MAIEAHDPGYPWWVTSNPHNPHYAGGAPPAPEFPVDPTKGKAVAAEETAPPADPAVVRPLAGGTVILGGHLPSVEAVESHTTDVPAGQDEPVPPTEGGKP